MMKPTRFRRAAQGWLILCTALIALAGDLRAAGAASEPEDMATVYDFYIGGIRAGKLTVNATFGRLSYSAEAELQTAGIVGVFYEASFSAEAVGRIGAAGLSPARFSANSREGRRKRFVEVSFSNGAPRAVRADPEFRIRPWSIRPGDQSGAADPLSAALAAIAPAPAGQICNRTADMFDGERRFAVEIGPPHPDHGRIRCEAVYVRVAGFKPKMMGKRARSPFTLFFAARDDGLYQAVRATAETDFGLAVVLLRD